MKTILTSTTLLLVLGCFALALLLAGGPLDAEEAVVEMPAAGLEAAADCDTPFAPEAGEAPLMTPVQQAASEDALDLAPAGEGCLNRPGYCGLTCASCLCDSQCFGGDKCYPVKIC